MSKIEQEVEELVTKPIENIGYEVYDVIYRKEGKENYLTIFIDKPEGISLDDCEKVNNEITDLLDEKNIIKEQYFLEISSPGIERNLRKDEHFEKNIGKKIIIKTFKKIEELNDRQIEGFLRGFDNETIKIENDNKEIIIQRKNITLIKTVYEF